MTSKPVAIRSVLFVCPESPWPPTSGPRHLSNLLLREAVRRWKCYVVGFARDQEEEANWRAFAEGLGGTAEIHIFRRRRGLRLSVRRLCAALLLRPPSGEAFCHPDANREIARLCREEQIDVVHLDSFNVLKCLSAHNARPSVLVPYDAFSMKAARDCKVLWLKTAGWLALWHRIVFSRLERTKYRACTVVAPVSEVDSAWLRGRARLPCVRSLGVPLDERWFQREGPGVDNAEETGLVVMGVFRIPAVGEGLREFMREILPRLRRAAEDIPVMVWGRGASAVAKSDASSGVTVVDEVEDYEGFLRRATIVAYPQRSGAGIQTKLQQAMACGRPVVARLMSLEPLEAVSGKHALGADENETFAQHIVTLWRDKSLRANLGEAGADLMREKFSERKMGERLAEIYALAVSRGEASTEG